MPKKFDILLIGLGPLPYEDGVSLAPGIRTWQFLQGIKDAYKVLLFTKYIGPDTPTGIKIITQQNDYIHYGSSENFKVCGKFVSSLFEKYKFEAVIFSGSTSLSILLDYVPFDLPLWFDLFGNVIAEGQVKSYAENDNFIVENYINMELKALNRADIFSVVSTPQMYATIGELALIGRLNKYTLGYEFCKVVPCSYFDDEKIFPKKVLRGIKVDYDDFVVLWSGGFNNWTDIKTLFFALEGAMKENPKIKFVATGGEIEGVSEKIYREFKNFIKHSKYKSNFILCGWVPKTHLPNYYLESDIAINIDKISYEPILGSRNRFLGWIKHDLPILTTPLSEIASILADNEACFTFVPEDVDSLRETLLHVASLPKVELKKVAMKAKEIFNSFFGIEETIYPLKEWLYFPQKAPDWRSRKNKQITFIEKSKLKKLYADSRDLRLIREKKLFKLYKTIRKILKKEK